MLFLNKPKTFLIHIILPLLAGLFIYILWRGVFFIDPRSDLFPLFLSPNVPKWIIYNLPDGFWLYAFLCSFAMVWSDEDSSKALIWTSGAVVTSMFSEFSQAMHWIRGTFDWGDLIAYLAASICFWFNYKKGKF